MKVPNGCSSKLSENNKNCPQITRQSGTNEPLLGFLQASPPNKLSFRIKKHSKGIKESSLCHKANNHSASTSDECTDVKVYSQESYLFHSLSTR